MFELDGRIAVVTGASAGLGERFARVLHDAGAKVVVTARRADRLELRHRPHAGRRRRLARLVSSARRLSRA